MVTVVVVMVVTVAVTVMVVTVVVEMVVVIVVVVMVVLVTVVVMVTVVVTVMVVTVVVMVVVLTVVVTVVVETVVVVVTVAMAITIINAKQMEGLRSTALCPEEALSLWGGRKTQQVRGNRRLLPPGVQGLRARHLLPGRLWACPGHCACRGPWAGRPCLPLHTENGTAAPGAASLGSKMVPSHGRKGPASSQERLASAQKCLFLPR